ncbi:hypothetical protein MPL3356_90221 [Mesorhizobium plurifarium]|uniref:Uncharacterized protein n=1 Tax=Mesorhizobium plurifarium TaxID=69974 RepID=A0A090FXA3_MESPL|nr:hypothetical protein MPL3356_90221 [Mesorhizobium plurifarium]CDX46355.1 hypothetical protein MPLDJ20_80336 [Mesorhizobium plurifarium]
MYTIAHMATIPKEGMKRSDVESKRRAVSQHYKTFMYRKWRRNVRLSNPLARGCFA